MTKLLLSLALSFLLTSTLLAEESADPVVKQLHIIYEAEWQQFIKDNPLEATYAGDKRYNDSWPDFSLEAFEKRHKHRVEVLKHLDTVDTSKFVGQELINFQLFMRRFALDVAGHKFQYYLIPLNHREGIQTEDQIGDIIDFDNIKDYEDWISRLKNFGKYMDQTLALLDKGIEQKIVHARIVMERVPAQVRAQIVEDPTKSLFYHPFLRMKDKITEADKAKLQQAGQLAIKNSVVPAYERMLKFIQEKYIPACNEIVGIQQVPQGAELYAHLTKVYTTTNFTPSEIHDIGLKEVARIRAAMEQVQRDVKFNGTFAEFIQHMRTDPQFYYKTPEELYAATQVVCKRIDPQLVKLFKTLPRIPYGVEAIPANIAPDTTAAYYRPPDAKGARAGMYFVNLYKPDTRPKYEIEALTLHEAVPGHHLQLALATELYDLPTFRAQWGYTAFIEGWGLYSESLGKELGCYQTPYDRFGQLTYEMWRAIRLVLDTGIHSKGWTRQQSIEFFANNSSKSLHDIENEVDRYIAWPGQALAYKMGELKIQALRKKAEQELGNKFDIREFHDAVLLNGAVTMEVLEELITEWIKLQKTKY
jgi:prolyl oligopeptidase